MVVLINFLGGPSAGKTSLGSKVFARLKDMELNTEYVTEFVKGWAREGRTVGPFDQFYIFGKETHNQSRLFKDDSIIIIADSPVMLTGFYQSHYNDGDNSLSEPCKDFYRLAKEHGVEVMNFFLPRKKRYQKKGRFQTEEEANAVTVALKEWLANEGYEYEELTCADKDRADIVIERLREITNNFEGMIEGEETTCTI